LIRVNLRLPALLSSTWQVAKSRSQKTRAQWRNRIQQGIRAKKNRDRRGKKKWRALSGAPFFVKDRKEAIGLLLAPPHPAMPLGSVYTTPIIRDQMLISASDPKPNDLI
jgi:hypothetical protein